jgi:hypothetical protein
MKKNCVSGIIIIILLFIIVGLVYLFRNYISFYPKNEYFNTDHKYTLSLLVICKNESMIINEFVNHYKWQGVEHIYFIDNGSDDNMLEIIQPYINEGYITYYYKPEKHSQITHYNNVYDEIKNETKWLIVCDSDEYIYNRTKNKTILDYVKRLDYNEIPGIQLPWKMFGSSGFKEQPKENIRSSFVWRKNDKISHKLILNTSLTNSLDIHYHKYMKGENLINDPDELALNHYIVMSEEYFRKVKMTRGDVDSTKYTDMRDMKYFENHDFKEVIDEELKNLLNK